MYYLLTHVKYQFSLYDAMCSFDQLPVSKLAMHLSQRRQRSSTPCCISSDFRTKRQKIRWRAGWRWTRWKKKLGWVRVQNRERERDRGFAGCCFNKLERLLCRITSFLCARTNEIGAVIIPTLSTGYDRGLCYLNQIYGPILASVCSLPDTFYIRLLTVYMLELNMILLPFQL